MASQQGLKLLGLTLTSPFSTRVIVSLNMKGIRYEFVEADLENKSQLLLQSNPVHKKVPILIHNGKPICESLIILQYIEETWPCSPNPLLPSDPYERALARFWAAFIDDKLDVSLEKINKNPDKEAQAKGIEEVKAIVAFLEDALKSIGKGKTYFGGESVGLVDLVFGSHYGVVKAAEILGEVTLINEQSAPALSALLEALKRNEQVKDVLTDTALLVQWYRKTFHSQPQA